jgi:hypothetical protein
MRVADDCVDSDTLDRVRAVVEDYLQSKGPISLAVEEISPNVYVVVNG